MPRPSHRAKILSEGLKVVHERGFGGASVRDIVQAAGVPQGSFTNHFASKEAFGLEVMDLYFANSREMIRQTLCNDSLAPLQRLRDYVDGNLRHISLNQTKNGCLFGNFAVEASDHSEVLRIRVVEIFAEVQECVAYCLGAAVQAGELPGSADIDVLAQFVVSSLQGAILLAKAQRSPVPVENFRDLLFSVVLR
jgi:TetR/AcrR family transcriptional regulator, transcriptional repressor for nem operon